MPSTILGTLLVVSHLTFITLLEDRYYCYPKIEMRKTFWVEHSMQFFFTKLINFNSNFTSLLFQ